ncbi:hypothetical protein AC1031_017177 [Aphanomyces cochlioides]|nr:hypothetical protein AC1031_017177 [Aphanomyces cochlioides]
MPNYRDLAEVHSISNHEERNGALYYLVHWMYPQLRDGKESTWYPADELDYAAAAIERYELFRTCRRDHPDMTYAEFVSKEIRNHLAVGADDKMSCSWEAIRQACRLLQPTLSLSRTVVYESIFEIHGLKIEDGVPRKYMKRFMNHVHDHGLPISLSTYDVDLFPKPRPAKDMLRQVLMETLMEFTNRTTVFMLVTSEGYLSHCRIV